MNWGRFHRDRMETARSRYLEHWRPAPVYSISTPAAWPAACASGPDGTDRTTAVHPPDSPQILTPRDPGPFRDKRARAGGARHHHFTR